eukprot:1342591-Pyramimonas_sp.AAC.1
MAVPVKEWQASAAAAVPDTERRHQAAIAELMIIFHRDPNTADAPVQTQYDACARSVHVVFIADIPPRDGASASPLLPTAKSFPKVASNPRAVAIRVGEKRPHPVAELETYWALPASKCHR